VPSVLSARENALHDLTQQLCAHLYCFFDLEMTRMVTYTHRSVHHMPHAFWRIPVLGMLVAMLAWVCLAAPPSASAKYPGEQEQQSTTAVTILGYDSRPIDPPVVTGCGDTWIQVQEVTGAEFCAATPSSHTLPAALSGVGDGSGKIVGLYPAASETVTVQSSGTWQSSGMITGLQPGTQYTLKARSAATHTEAASTTTGTTLELPSVGTVKKSDTWVSVEATVDDGGAQVVYASSPTGPWASSGMFTGLQPDTSYTFYVKREGAAGTVAVPVSVSTVPVPGDPCIDSLGPTWIQVNAEDGVEYSLDGQSWNTEGFFDGLNPGESYTVCARAVGGTLMGGSAQVTLPLPEDASGAGSSSYSQAKTGFTSNTGDGRVLVVSLVALCAIAIAVVVAARRAQTKAKKAAEIKRHQPFIGGGGR
jgi:hypothetical protein